MSDSDNRFQVRAVAVIGVGMIGGSLALALKARHCVEVIIGAGRSHANLQRALDLGAIDQIAPDPASAAAQADLIVLATPVSAIADLFAALRPALTAHQIITDVGSVKQGVLQAAAALGDEISRFVPGHPIAGKEHSGVQAATADLFVNHNVVLTPSARTDAAALATVQQMWCAVGARVSILDAALHDRVLSVTSHLPHVLAYAMVDFFTQDPNRAHCDDMAAGGFYDFTRTASSDPKMWRDICMMNREPILQHLQEYGAQLQRIRQLIADGDGDALEALFHAAKEARAQVAERR